MSLETKFKFFKISKENPPLKVYRRGFSTKSGESGYLEEINY